ncbi:MAG: DUF4396 domain-containing protein [Candidatus Saccharibacteria bacterium]
MHKSTYSLAVSATLHCLTGCAIGEIVCLLIGTGFCLSNSVTLVLSIALAFAFGYTLTSLPLLKMGLPLKTIMTIALAADTVSIAVMELADNTVMVAIPGAMNAGLVNPLFWLTMPLSLFIGFIVAVPVNKYLLDKGKGHAVVHEYHMKSHSGGHHA